MSSRSSKRRRRDTFDLSGRRGLALVGPRKRAAGISVLVDEEVTTSSNHAASDDRWDYVTPRAGSVEVDVEAMAERILRTLDDGGSREEEGRRPSLVDAEIVSLMNKNKHIYYLIHT